MKKRDKRKRMRKRLERLSGQGQPVEPTGAYVGQLDDVLRELGTAPEDCEPGSATTQQDGWGED